MTGLGIAPALQHRWEEGLAARRLGMELHSAGDGRAHVSMTVTAEMLNERGTLHGVYLFMLGDSALGCACETAEPVTVGPATHVAFHAPAREGDRLDAVAIERSRTRQQAVYDVTVRRQVDHRVIAEFRGRSRTTSKESTS